MGVSACLRQRLSPTAKGAERRPSTTLAATPWSGAVGWRGRLVGRPTLGTPYPVACRRPAIARDPDSG